MKYIVKEAEPIAFTTWKNLANENWKPTYNELSGTEKDTVYDALLKEQGFICCYCERELRKNDYHIEHLKPKDKHKYPQFQLEYSNLLCSCQRELKSGEPRHCGNSKDNWFDEQLFISPLNPDCEIKFKYTYDGYIEPKDENDVSTKTTIEKLHLGIDKLNAMRKGAIEPFLIDENINENEIANYLVDKIYNNGKYNEFYTTIKYLFGN